MKLKKLLLIPLGIILFLLTSMFIEPTKEVSDIYIVEDYSVFNRMDYNSLIKHDLDKSYEFFDKITKDNLVTRFIISYALTYNVPINLSMALVMNESGFNQEATNYNEWSIDHGLYQLNSYTYRKYKESYLKEVTNNIRLGNKHLSDNFKKVGSWEEAVISYNCGYQKRIPRNSVKYMSKILITEQKLNQKLVKFLNIK